MLEFLALATFILFNVWGYIIFGFIEYQLKLHEWKKKERFVDDYTCMCGSTNGACIYEGSHSFISTKEFWMTKKPKYD